MKNLIVTTSFLLAIALSPLALAQATHPSENTPGKTGAPDSSGPGMSGSTNGTSSTAPDKQNPASGTDASKGASK